MSCWQGIIFLQLVKAYAAKKDHEKVIALGSRIKHVIEFQRSKAHLEYAKSLYYRGRTEEAEKEFAAMKGKFAHYEPRYYYGSFLADTGRTGKATSVFQEMISEQSHLGPREKAAARKWIQLTKTALKSLKQRMRM